MTTALVWFRNDLRTLDHKGLLDACKADRVIALYCFHPEHYREGDFGIPKTGPFRAQFLIETVSSKPRWSA